MDRQTGGREGPEGGWTDEGRAQRTDGQVGGRGVKTVG